MIDPIELVVSLKFVLRNDGLKAQIFKQHSLLPYFSFKNVYSKKSKKTTLFDLYQRFKKNYTTVTLTKVSSFNFVSHLEKKLLLVF